MHFVLVNRWYPPHGGGGIAAYNYSLAKNLTRMGHQVTVVASRSSLAIPEKEHRHGETVYRIFSSEYTFIKSIPFLARYQRFFRDLMYSIRVARVLRRLERASMPDVLEFADVEAEGFWYLRGKKRARISVRCHTPMFILRKYQRKAEMLYDTDLISSMEKECVRKADIITAPSEDMASLISRECGLPREKITVIPNGLAFFPETEPGEKAAENFTVLYVGRLELSKGIEILAKAIPEVIKNQPAARFIFAGHDRVAENGISRARWLQDFFEEKKIREKIMIAPDLNEDELLNLYKSADVAVVPSMLYESFSYACAQAMAAGLPVVASRIGGIPETVEDNISGILVPPGDSAALAGALLKLAENPDLRRAMGRAGMQRAKNLFDARKTTMQFIKIMEKHERQA